MVNDQLQDEDVIAEYVKTGFKHLESTGVKIVFEQTSLRGLVFHLHTHAPEVSHSCIFSCSCGQKIHDQVSFHKTK